MGTASYFSPEQAQGAQPDPRSDLYSLGIVMYEMVAGRPPFTGENPVSIAYKQVHDPPQPLNQIVADIPRPFEAIIAKLLAKDPKLRYPSAHALRDDLRRFRNGEQVQALVSAVAGSQARTTVAPVTAAATTVMASAAPTRTVSPSGMPMATAVAPATARASMAGYPPGASPAAHYYEDGHSRTGWYALAAFIALIALVAGGVLLFQALNKDDTETVGITLEDYTNQRLDVVTAALRAQELAYEAVPEENAVVAEEFVHRTDPAAGTLVTAGTVIKLYYRPTPDLVQVPNVAGRSLQDARDILGAEGFAIDEVSEENDLDSGLVIRTEPPGGERVRQDTRITIVVSGGPQQIAIPASVIGDSVDVATQLLASEQYGFDVVTESQQDAEIPAGIVIATRPEPGTLVARGSSVTLVVSAGPGQVTVPPVVGLTEAVARNSLASNNLGASVEYRDLQPGDPNDGLVISQSVPSGTAVERDTVVALVVGRATAPVTTTSTTTTTTTLPPETTVPVTVTTLAP
jgi:serine/threonine-protein kinase